MFSLWLLIHFRCGASQIPWASIGGKDFTLYYDYDRQNPVWTQTGRSNGSSDAWSLCF